MSSKQQKLETTTLTPSQVSRAIDLIGNSERSLFIWGPPGVSKSAIAKQRATARGVAFVDLRLSQMDPTDLRGIPYPVPEGDGVQWAPPLTLPRDLDVQKVVAIEAIATRIKFRNRKGTNKIHYILNPEVTVRPLDVDNHVAEIVSQEMDNFTVVLKSKETGKPVAGKLQYEVKGKATGILALEEFNSAPNSVQAASYQLVLDRLLGDEYEVPEGVQILAMGNRDTDKGITFKMATPIANRFIHVEIVPNFDDWQAWALSAYVHPEVVGFLTAFKNKMFEFEPSTASRGFPTPRSWDAVSDILKANDDLPDVEGLALVNGAVGDACGIQFWEFRKIAAELPRVEQILNGTLKTMDPKHSREVALHYALATTICYELSERANEVKRLKDWEKSKEYAEWLKLADNYLGFSIDNFQTEITIMAAKAAIGIHKLPFNTQKMKNFNKFAAHYKDFIL